MKHLTVHCHLNVPLHSCTSMRLAFVPSVPVTRPATLMLGALMPAVTSMGSLMLGAMRILILPAYGMFYAFVPTTLWLLVIAVQIAAATIPITCILVF